MKLEQQVCSLELAKRLKELGVKQESLFWWNEGDGMPDQIEYIPEMAGMSTKELPSAFTAAELINRLQTVAKSSIIVALDDSKVADTLAKQLIKYYEEGKV